MRTKLAILVPGVLIALGLLGLTFIPAFAEKNLVGEAAPDFSIGTMVNGVPERTLADCQGEVVLIKYWGMA